MRRRPKFRPFALRAREECFHARADTQRYGPLYNAKAGKCAPARGPPSFRSMCDARARAGNVSLRALAAKVPALCDTRARGMLPCTRVRPKFGPIGNPRAREECIPACAYSKSSGQICNAHARNAPLRARIPKFTAALSHIPRGGAPDTNLRNSRPPRHPSSLIASPAGNAALNHPLNMSHF